MSTYDDTDLIGEICSRAVVTAADTRPVIGIAGSVAVGKSSMAERLAAALGAQGKRAEIVGTDGFLFPNAILRSRDLYYRKGFPESYDEERLAAFVRLARTGAAIRPCPHFARQGCHQHWLGLPACRGDGFVPFGN